MKRVALFVGVDRYEDGAFRDLRYSVADAAALAAAFGRYGFETHVATNPGSGALQDEVERRTAGLGPGDVFVFFFAGHGYTGAGGEHLLICRDDRLIGLRHNRAGVPVDLLEDLTNGHGFHRAFLLDACRTDVFAGAVTRGAATRDLGLVSMPDARVNPGTCCVLRSCDRFCPALEFDDLGHGVFTRAILDFLETSEGRTEPMGEGFAGGVRERMREILWSEGSPVEQCPTFQTNGAAFALFGNVGLEYPAQATSFPVASGVGFATAVGAVAMNGELCETCGRYRPLTELFKCRGCGKWHCAEHQDRKSWLCGRCAATQVRDKDCIEREGSTEKTDHGSWFGRVFSVREQFRRRAGKTKTIVLPGGAEMELVWCPPGSFVMGSPLDEEGREEGETQHRVVLTRGFWMGKYPVTQLQWKSVMASHPWRWEGETEMGSSLSCSEGDDLPVENVSWEDCMDFCREAGMGMQLPTEAQWEYACRAGCQSAYAGSGRLDDMGWFDGNSMHHVHPVGQMRPNAWGLHDMHGNVWEWCADWKEVYPKWMETDPKGASAGRYRVLRGGGWYDLARYCRSACRNSSVPADRDGGIGFRPVVLLD